MMETKNLFFRLLASPAILLLLATFYTYALVKHFAKYIQWGGEFITLKKDDRKNIEDIYELLKPLVMDSALKVTTGTTCPKCNIDGLFKIENGYRCEECLSYFDEDKILISD